jgi:alcohol dehydrogenase class IV
MKEAGLATKLSELNIDKENIIESLLDEVNEERFANNPMPFDSDKLKQLILEHL